LKHEHTYKTIASPSEGFYREKGSRFISYAVFCCSEDEVMHFISQWRKEHYQSRHICWAYRLGEIQQRVRSNDDGEPTNSAGQPILRQIRSFELSNVLVGVVRYFGGVKLGVSGLVSAYKQASFDALNKATIVEMEIVQKVLIICSYEQMPSVMNFIKTNAILYSSPQFFTNCTIELELPLAKLDENITVLQRICISVNIITTY